MPAVERVLQTPALRRLAAIHGRPATTDAVRGVLAGWRDALAAGGPAGEAPSDAAIAEEAGRRLAGAARATLVPVFNLTGTLLHTNLGRAPLPPEAIEAVSAIAAGASNLEYDLERGKRGERDCHIAPLVERLTGAEAAMVVNNNAAALLLTLNTLARNKEVIVSRGELIEIGDGFRLPDIMARAGCRLREVGTTNRTRLADYADAIGPRTALLLKVHMSNYVIEGFTAAADTPELAALAREHGLPLVTDLGSGALVDLEPYGLAHEPTVAEALKGGASIVTFSGDKLLGGPQAGILAGERALMVKLRRNPMHRALRCDKMTLAALAALLRLYRDPERLARRLPALALATRPTAELRGLAPRLSAALGEALGDRAEITVEEASCQIGSGALPREAIASVALVLRPCGPKRGAGARLERLSAAFRALPKPVIGRVRKGALWLDLRGLDDEDGFVAQLARLAASRETDD